MSAGCELMEGGLSWVVPLPGFFILFMETKGCPGHALAVVKRGVQEDEEACKAGVSISPGSFGQSRSHD